MIGLPVVWRGDRAPAIGSRSDLARRTFRSSALPGPDRAGFRAPRLSPFPHCSPFLAAPLAAIDTGVDLDAFGSGIQIALFVALVGIALFGVLGWIIRQLGRSV
jgi:hypothetical protein